MFGTNNDKPSAAEQMVAKLLGFTPEQMQQTITGFRDTIVAVADQLKRVEETQAVILAEIKELRNGYRDALGKRGSDGGPGDGRDDGGDLSGQPLTVVGNDGG